MSKSGIMALLMAAVTIAAIAYNTTLAIAGNCDHSWQTASDGSSCGDRSADSRPGGQSN